MTPKQHEQVATAVRDGLRVRTGDFSTTAVKESSTSDTRARQQEQEPPQGLRGDNRPKPEPQPVPEPEPEPAPEPAPAPASKADSKAAADATKKEAYRLKRVEEAEPAKAEKIKADEEKAANAAQARQFRERKAGEEKARRSSGGGARPEQSRRQNQRSCQSLKTRWGAAFYPAAFYLTRATPGSKGERLRWSNISANGVWLNIISCSKQAWVAKVKATSRASRRQM